VLKHRVDLLLVKLELATTLWSFGTPVDEVDGAVSILEVSWSLVRWIFAITPGQVVSAPSATGAFAASCLVMIVVAGTFGVV
jgi:hypothetical protein